jgi:sRNA-binding carbon storage regulator CsrA
MLHSHNSINYFLNYNGTIDREVTMLDLSRKQQESLSITTPMGEIIQISILDTTPDTTMLGIDAPSACTILRVEIFPETKHS